MGILKNTTWPIKLAIGAVAVLMVSSIPAAWAEDIDPASKTSMLNKRLILFPPTDMIFSFFIGVLL
jgi:hypothetical protein